MIALHGSLITLHFCAVGNMQYIVDVWQKHMDMFKTAGEWNEQFEPVFI